MASRSQSILAAISLALLLGALVAINQLSRPGQSTLTEGSSSQPTAQPAPVIPAVPSSQSSPSPTSQSLSSPKTPLPPIGSSEFVNTAAPAAYVGSQACGECHESQFHSYSETTHSRALDDIDLAQEPPDGAFEHAVSGRDYRIYRKDGQLWHRESVKDESGELVLCDFPMRYVIGSGNHSRSYLVERDGFLVESPVTWYTARQAWGMSPGYQDDPHQQGFARPARFLCVNCHAGEVSAKGGSIHRLEIGEQPIGCERCHGPGSLHVERHRNSDGDLPEPDNTIVNPARLSRERREDICGQCHLATIAHSQVRGRTAADFRPGLRLTDFMVHYQLEIPEQAMSVVGHVEQLRLSKCYQLSEMDCNTCHDLHAQPLSPDAARAAYRNKCLECHQKTACKADLDHRNRANDNCLQCHMPTGPTDIPHFAFTHHRIGIHDEPENASADAAVGRLVPLNSVDHLPPLDRQRCLALAYLSLADSEPRPEAKQAYTKRGLDVLYRLHEQGIRDPEVEAALAWGFWRQNPRRSVEHALTALQGEPLHGMARRDALAVLARTYFDEGQFSQAVKALQQLAELQLDAEDSALLGQSLSRLGRLNEAIEAVERAASIEPHWPELHEGLAMMYGSQGANDQAARHQTMKQILQALKDRVEAEAANQKGPARE